jgi:Flp pilus assembly protein TadG
MFSLKKLWKDQKGAFAMQFALMIIPLMGCTGLAIDGGRAFLARYELAAALDAAALAVGSSTGTDAQLKAIAQKFVDQNYRAGPAGSVVLDLHPSSTKITLNGKVNMDTFFMPIFGWDKVEISADSEVVRGGNNVEVALALDITESMSGSKISALRTAAKNLVTTVVNDTQTPYFSKVALVPWGTNVHVSSTYADVLRGPIAGPVNITAATWKNGTAKTITGATWKSGSAFATVTKITKVSSRVQLTFSANPSTLANGDFIYISGVSSPSNNSYGAVVNNLKFMVADKTTSSPWTMNLMTTGGVYVTPPSGSNNATNGTVQECFNAGCEVQITASAHGYSAGDWLYISSVAGMTQINNAAGATWTVGSTPAVTTNTFMLSGSDGPSYSNYSSAGTAQKCFTNICEVQVTAAGHGLANGDLTQISGVNGMTQLNLSGTSYWTAASVTTNTFIAATTVGPSYSTYTSAGTSQCLQEGCKIFRFTAKSGSVVTKTSSNCVTERTGTEKYTDAAPGSGQWLGRDYPGASGTLVECNTANSIIPLTANKTTLKNAIDAMTVTGSTAGQIGTAWGWYMVSPNFASLWPNAENKPLAYGTKDLVKVVVLMTDGDFNTGHCKGVTSNDYAYSSVSTSDRINCNTTNGAPFDQAKAICDNMKANDKKIIVYTVGFQLDVQSAKDFMAYCATDSAHAFLAENSTQLQSAFDSIATSISRLRIAK